MNLLHFQEGSFIAEIGMTEKELVLMPIKQLNKEIKGRNVSVEDKKRIKQTRRTLLNRYIQRRLKTVMAMGYRKP